MRFLFILMIIPALVFSQALPEGVRLENDIHFLHLEFLENPVIELKEDSLEFEMNEDSVFVNKCINQQNDSAIWLHYPDQGFNDFWELHARYKNNQGWAARQEHDLMPIKFIREYFHDKEIELLDVFIYSSSVKPRLFLQCGSCYGGTDFLFKIEKSDYKKLCKKAQMELKII